MGTLNPMPDTTVTAVARHIVECLTAAGISRLEASSRTGIPRSTFYRKADGHGAFDVEELARIAALLDLPVSELLRGAEVAA